MQTNLFIPSKIRIGFQERKDTFTGKLAYVIYYDEKGKIRKESSWSRWCKPELGVLELDNIPQSGYIFNKGIQRSRDWGSGRSVIRVYDPRDFEFEIDVDNLIGILMHSDVSKRDIVEQCIYAWSGGNLILLPTNSDAYIESVKYTNKQSKNISKKDLIPGAQYSKKKSDGILTYIGYYNWWEWETEYTRGYSNNGIKHILKGKKHIFYENDSHNFITPSIPTLSETVSLEPVDNYAFLVDEFFSTIKSLPVKDIKIDTELMKIKYVENPKLFYRYPRLCIINDKCLHILENTDYNYCSNIPYNMYNTYKYSIIPLDIIFDTSITLKNQLRLSSASSRFGFDVRETSYVDSNRIIQSMLPVIQRKGYDEALTIEQYIDVMSELGYGICKLVLENGNEVEHLY